MRYRMTFLGGLALGYVLGSAAGRERYEQIKRGARRVADSPAVQETAGLVRAQASKVFSRAKDLAKDKVSLPWRDDSSAEQQEDRFAGEKLNGVRP